MIILIIASIIVCIKVKLEQQHSVPERPNNIIEMPGIIPPPADDGNNGALSVVDMRQIDDRDDENDYEPIGLYIHPWDGGVPFVITPQYSDTSDAVPQTAESMSTIDMDKALRDKIDNDSLLFTTNLSSSATPQSSPDYSPNRSCQRQERGTNDIFIREDPVPLLRYRTLSDMSPQASSGAASLASTVNYGGGQMTSTPASPRPNRHDHDISQYIADIIEMNQTTGIDDDQATISYEHNIPSHSQSDSNDDEYFEDSLHSFVLGEDNSELQAAFTNTVYIDNDSQDDEQHSGGDFQNMIGADNQANYIEVNAPPTPPRLRQVTPPQATPPQVTPTPAAQTPPVPPLPLGRPPRPPPPPPIRRVTRASTRANAAQGGN
jgi:hypothetical protein